MIILLYVLNGVYKYDKDGVASILSIALFASTSSSIKVPLYKALIVLIH